MWLYAAAPVSAGEGHEGDRPEDTRLGKLRAGVIGVDEAVDLLILARRFQVADNAVHPRVDNLDLYVVFTVLDEIGDVEAVGCGPYTSCIFAVYEDFAHGGDLVEADVHALAFRRFFQVGDRGVGGCAREVPDAVVGVGG